MGPWGGRDRTGLVINRSRSNTTNRLGELILVLQHLLEHPLYVHYPRDWDDGLREL